MRRLRGAQCAAHASHSQARVGDHHDRADAPGGVDACDEISTGCDEKRDAIPGLDAHVHQTGGDLPGPGGQHRPGDTSVGAQIGECDAGVPRTRLQRMAHGDDVRGAGNLGRRRRGGIEHTVRDPGQDVREPARGILGDEVSRLLVAMDIRVRHAHVKIAQIAIGEDWIIGTPGKEHRHIQGLDSFGDGVQGRGAGVIRRQRDVGDEVANGLPAACVGVRRSESPRDIG